MAMTLATIKERIRARGISSSDVSDSDLSIIINDALSEYSSYNPDTVFTLSSGYLTTVANQQEYDFPAGAITILNVFWNEDYTLDINEIFDVNEVLEGDLYVAYSKVATYVKYYSMSWEIKNNKIYLIPVPAQSDVKVAVLYGKAQTLDTLNEIEDQLFYDLVYALALQAVGLKHSQTSGFRAGAYAQYPTAAVVIMQTAQKKLDEVRQRLSILSGRSANATRPINQGM